jgi:hypothetical protein
MPRLIAVLALSTALAACDRPPQPPDKTAPPEPQVTAGMPQARMEPASRARSQTEHAVQRQRAAVEAPGG